MSRRGRLSLAATLVIAATLLATCGSREVAAQAPPATIGLNVGNLTYWSGAYIYTDLARGASDLRGRDWKNLPAEMLEADGWPKPTSKGTVYHMTLLGDVPQAPPGPYRCRLSPGWTPRAVGDADLKGAGELFQLVPRPQAHVINLQLTQTDDGAPLKLAACDIATPPLLARAGETEVALNPQFVEELKGFPVLRFMDLMKTNGAPAMRWAERTLPTTRDQSGPKGMAIEHLVAIANATGADPWFTLPYDADEDYYRRFAQLVKRTLHPGRRIYVELSNEVWNLQFAQAKKSLAEGQVAFPDKPARIANGLNYARRSIALFKIWRQEFADSPTRLVRVLAVQAVVPEALPVLLDRTGIAKEIDAIAIAPYFGGMVNPPVGTSFDADALARDGRDLIDRAIASAVAHKKTANAHGLRLIAYEGGQHYVPQPGRPDLATAMAGFNQDPRMADLYTHYLAEWQRQVGDLLVLYSATGNNVFGMRTYTGQPLSNAPKMRATMEFIGRK